MNGYRLLYSLPFPQSRYFCDLSLTYSYIYDFQSQIRLLEGKSDKTESQIESLTTTEQTRKKGKRDDPKKGEKEVCFRKVLVESIFFFCDYILIVMVIRFPEIEKNRGSEEAFGSNEASYL